MRAVLRDWHEPPFAALVGFVGEHSAFTAVDIRGWRDFELATADG